MMPIIEVKVIKNVFDTNQKRQIISNLSNAMIDIIGVDTPAVRSVTSCLIVEIEEQHWGIGGRGLSASDFHDLVMDRR